MQKFVWSAFLKYFLYNELNTFTMRDKLEQHRDKCKEHLHLMNHCRIPKMMPNKSKRQSHSERPRRR